MLDKYLKSRKGRPLSLDEINHVAAVADSLAFTIEQMARIDVARRSSRTGQVHPIGGFVGEADYEGELSEFVPFLRAAKWVGVGRQTVWGKGMIELHI